MAKKIIFTDYSTVYYQTLNKQPIPIAREGKFVQLRTEREEYILFAPKELSTYHANIVARFCSAHKPSIQGYYRKGKSHYQITDPKWQVVGGGWLKIDDKDKYLELSGISMAYGSFDSIGLKENLASLPYFTDYTIIIK